jgi:hypothetical protein
VCPRAVLDTVVKRKIPSPRRESNPRTPNRPAPLRNIVLFNCSLFFPIRLVVLPVKRCVQNFDHRIKICVQMSGSETRYPRRNFSFLQANGGILFSNRPRPPPK